MAVTDKETTRCINIDWLEVYCLENNDFYPMDADFFRRGLYQVIERDYGTKVWGQMFTIYGDDGERLVEVRRAPKSTNENGGYGILDPRACHVRLCNRTCYFENCVDWFRSFLYASGYEVMRISRIDIALDFERFDYGDYPAKFLRRYMEGKYSKINQTEIAPHGKDSWNGREWNSISWGSKTSCISTKFYNKTLELKQASDKPYIRQAWAAAGLIDDWHTVTKKAKDGTTYTPDIWRVEFSIKSGTRNWFLIEDQSGKKVKKRSIRNTLAMYDTRQKLIDMFFSLADHYFHFKVVEYIHESKAATSEALAAIAIDYGHELAAHLPKQEKRLQRKDRCADKLLFRPADAQQFYTLENIASAEHAPSYIKRLIALLYRYRETHTLPDIYRACNTILESAEMQRRLGDYPYPWPDKEVAKLREIVTNLVHDGVVPLNNDTAQEQRHRPIQQTLFGSVDEEE